MFPKNFLRRGKGGNWQDGNSISLVFLGKSDTKPFALVLRGLLFRVLVDANGYFEGIMSSDDERVGLEAGGRACPLSHPEDARTQKEV